MWNLKKDYKRTYLENRIRVTAIENKLMVIGQGRGRCKLEDWADMYTLLCIR